MLSLSILSTLYTASAQEAEPTPYDTSYSYDDSYGRPPSVWASPAGGVESCLCKNKAGTCTWECRPQRPPETAPCLTICAKEAEMYCPSTAASPEPSSTY